jgi:hypothetical protein
MGPRMVPDDEIWNMGGYHLLNFLVWTRLATRMVFMQTHSGLHVFLEAGNPKELVELRLAEGEDLREEKETSFKVTRVLLRQLSSVLHGQAAGKDIILNIKGVEPKTFQVFKSIVQLSVPGSMAQLEQLSIHEMFKLLQFLVSYEIRLWVPAILFSNPIAVTKFHLRCGPPSRSIEFRCRETTERFG